MSGTTQPTPPTAQPWWVLPGLAAGVLLIFAGALIASCFVANATLQVQMFTAATALSGTAVGYFFQSSAGSARKTEIAAAAPTPAPMPPAGV